MVGAGTVRIDDPSLTVREISGKNPLRVVLGDAKALPVTAKVFNEEAKTIIYGLHHENPKDDWHKVDPLTHFEAVLADLAARNISSVLVEGGKILHESLIKSEMWDEARIIRSNKHFRGGLKAPLLNLSPKKQEQYGNDQIAYYFRRP
jgi:diaminohydroxyphosphoribosylaminopyrimidine deaminase/5-amino-6-(5-phosphoribosylamino)uracil reductase